MKYVIPILILILFSCKDGKKYHDDSINNHNASSTAILDILEFQKNLNESYKNPETSPLPDRLRIDFESLDFFDADTTYVVKAFLQRTPDSEPFMMPTTTDRQSHERLFGIALFDLNGEKRRLELYQDLDLLEEDGFRDYLFLPFLDETNGNETYGGGRYIDLRIPEGDTLVIDFNKAYNPYCVYNKKYSCPLVPRQNYLTTKVKAGVRDFKKE